MQTFGLRCDELGCFSFSYKIVCKLGGLVSHIFLSTDSDLILSLFLFSHFLDLSFCFENPKMSVPLFVPHHCFLSWPRSHHAARGRVLGGEEPVGLGPGAAILSVTSVQQCHSDSCPSVLPLGPDGGSSTPTALTVVCGPHQAWPCLGRATPRAAVPRPAGASWTRWRTVPIAIWPQAQALFLWKLREILIRSAVTRSVVLLHLVFLLVRWIRAAFVPGSDVLPFSTRRRPAWWVGGVFTCRTGVTAVVRCSPLLVLAPMFFAHVTSAASCGWADSDEGDPG